MRISDEFVTYDASEEEKLIVSVGDKNSFRGLAKTNETAALIVDLLKEDTTEEDIIDKIASEYNAPRDEIGKDVKEFLGELRKIGAIVD